MKKVFLGGTCNESSWREELIPMLKCEYFNPVVKDWTPQCQEEKENQKIIEEEKTNYKMEHGEQE